VERSALPEPASLHADRLRSRKALRGCERYIEDAAQRAGVPVNVMIAIAKQEIDFGRNQKNPTGSAKGFFQFIDRRR